MRAFELHVMQYTAIYTKLLSTLAAPLLKQSVGRRLVSFTTVFAQFSLVTSVGHTLYVPSEMMCRGFVPREVTDRSS